MKIQVANICHSNKKFEGLGDPFDKRMTVSLYKFNVIMALFMTSFERQVAKKLAASFFLHIHSLPEGSVFSYVSLVCSQGFREIPSEQV